jgi:hypothetical protein
MREIKYDKKNKQKKNGHGNCDYILREIDIRDCVLCNYFMGMRKKTILCGIDELTKMGLKKTYPFLLVEKKDSNITLRSLYTS